MTGADMIARERARQICDEDYTSRHDDEHTCADLVDAAICYLENVSDQTGGRRVSPCLSAHWPWAVDEFKPHTNRRDLIRAGALIAAELDRMGRAK